MHGRVYYLVNLLLSFVPAAAQEPTPSAASPVIRADATTLVIPAGKHEVKAIIDAAGAFMQRNILVSAAELGMAEPIEIQTPMAIDRTRCETIVSQLLWSRRLVLIGSEKPTGPWEVIHSQGQRQDEISSRAILRPVEQVLANPDLVMPVTVHLDLVQVNATAATNLLRPIVAGRNTSLAVTGANALTVTGLQHEVAKVVRTVFRLDGREDEAPPPAEPQRLEDPRKALAELRAPVQPGDPLVGNGFDQMLAELGVPAEANVSAQVTHWSYPRVDGQKLQVAFTGDTVLWIRGSGHPLAARQEVPKAGPYIGQSVAQLKQRLGQPVSLVESALVLVVEFLDGTRVSVAHGRVIGFDRSGQGLQGTWRGQEQGERAGPVEFTVTGDRARFSAMAGSEWYEGTFTVDPSTSPARVVVSIDKCFAPRMVRRQVWAIFELIGNRLQMAGSQPGLAEYPSDWSPSGKVRVFELEREGR